MRFNAVILGLVPRICNQAISHDQHGPAAGPRVAEPANSADPRDKPEDDVGAGGPLL